jgi:hypothetical protein
MSDTPTDVGGATPPSRDTTIWSLIRTRSFKVLMWRGIIAGWAFIKTNKALILGLLVASILMVIACLVFKNNNRPHYSTPGKLDQLGSFIGGLSLFFSAIVIWIEAHSITRRNATIERQTTAINSFRLLYDEFWKEKEVAKIRRMIVSSDEYKQILKPILDKRNDMDARGELNSLCSKENLILDEVDRFFSVLVRMRSFDVSNEIQYLDNKQKILLEKILNEGYFTSFIKENRAELCEYMKNHWRRELYDPLESYDPLEIFRTSPGPIFFCVGGG